MSRNKRLIAAAALALPLAALGGCMTATPDQPYVPEGAAGTHGGFSEQRIAPDRFLVKFHGNELTSRERVEAYLLYRAAELTVQNGYDSFAMEHQGMEHDVRTYAEPRYGPWWGPYWHPAWGYYRGGYGWNYWDPWRGGPFWGSYVDTRTVEAFEARAEIAMMKGAPPPNVRHALDARTVMARLAPTIELPKRG